MQFLVLTFEIIVVEYDDTKCGRAVVSALIVWPKEWWPMKL